MPLNRYLSFTEFSVHSFYCSTNFDLEEAEMFETRLKNLLCFKIHSDIRRLRLMKEKKITFQQMTKKPTKPTKSNSDANWHFKERGVNSPWKDSYIISGYPRNWNEKQKYRKLWNSPLCANQLTIHVRSLHDFRGWTEGLPLPIHCCKRLS